MSRPATDRPRSSPYMEWVKTGSAARFNLVASGLMGCPLSFLEVTLADLEINGPSFYGYEPLKQAIAAHSSVKPECVVIAEGTSMVNHLALASLLEPGDEVIIEQPTYELLTATAGYLGATVRTFNRSAEQGFQIDVDQVSRLFSPRTKLVVITNLNNPSSVLTSEPILRELGNRVASIGAKVLVDEVYLEAVLAPRPRSAFHLGPEFVTTNSLTKVYGLNGLRCGWALAEPELARRMWRLNDLFGVIPSHLSERVGTRAFEKMNLLRDRTQSHLAANWQACDEWLGDCTNLDIVRPLGGTVLFPRLKRGTVETLCARLRSEQETSVVPGEFFGLKDHFRVGIGGAQESVREGLRRLRLTLDSMS